MGVRILESEDGPVMQSFEVNALPKERRNNQSLTPKLQSLNATKGLYCINTFY